MRLKLSKREHIKIKIGTMLQVLKEKNLLLSYSKTLDQIPHEALVFLFYHSKDVENCAIFPSDLNSNAPKPPHYAYVARFGKTFDGHHIAEKVLVSKNIFVGSQDRVKSYLSNSEILDQGYCILVTDVDLALNHLLLAAYGVSQDDFTIIGVTGTNGKTSVVQISGQLLEILYHHHVLKMGTLGMEIGDLKLPGSHVTMPDFPAFISALNVAQNSNINTVVMEATSHGLKENRLSEFKVNIAAFTNLTPDHLDFHGSMEDYRKSKEKLFQDVLFQNGTAIVDFDDDSWMFFVKAAAGRSRSLILVGQESRFHLIPKDLSIQFHSLIFLILMDQDKKSDLSGISGHLVLKNADEGLLLQAAFVCPLLGDFQYENILCVVGIGIALGFSLEKICNALADVKNIPGRLQIVKSAQNKSAPTVVVDYAHTPDALEKVLITCRKLMPKSGKIITVFGCGGDRDPSKRKAMGQIAHELSDVVIVTSDNPRTEDPDKIITEISAGISDKSNCIFERDRKKAIAHAMENSGQDDLVLIAGKGHEKYQIIGDIRYPFSDEEMARSILDGGSC